MLRYFFISEDFMTPYRRFCWKTFIVFTAVWFFCLIAKISTDAQKQDFGSFVDSKVKLHEMEKRTAKQRAIMDLWNISEADLTRPVDLFNEGGKI